MKRKWIFLAAAVLCIAAVFTGRAIDSIVTAPVMAVDNQLPMLVIDAGHGGFDGGAVGVGGVEEKNINLAIARNLYDLLTINGFDAVLTRESDVALGDSAGRTIRQRKNTDIHSRFDQAKSYKNAILLSIHQNKFTQANYFGAQIFYGPKNEQSKELGEMMQRRMIEMLQPENTRRCKACGDSVYLIHNAPMPALLIECGFLSNADDAAKLVDPDCQKKVAFTIFAGIAEYLGLQTPAETAVYRAVPTQKGWGKNGGNQE